MRNASTLHRKFARYEGLRYLGLMDPSSYQTEPLEDVSSRDMSVIWHAHPVALHSTGRADDVIVLGSGKGSISTHTFSLIQSVCTTGEKIVPIPQENHIVSSPYTAGAIIFGWGKPQPGVLIEPSAAYVVDPNNEAELVKYRNLIW